MDLTRYYVFVANAISDSEMLLADLERQYYEEIEKEIGETDWSMVILSIQRYINALYSMSAIHRFENVSKEMMEEIFRAYDSSTNSGKTTMSQDHVVTEYDTPRTIEQKYGVSWQEILSCNNMYSSGLTALQTISIPLPIHITEVSDEILVFGEHEGISVLGSDIQNEIRVSKSGADINILCETDSFAQHIMNMISTSKGDSPFYETYGTNLSVDEDWDAAAIIPVIQMRLKESIMQDPRVEIMEIEETFVSNTSCLINLKIKTINGTTVSIGKNI